MKLVSITTILLPFLISARVAAEDIPILCEDESLAASTCLITLSETQLEACTNCIEAAETNNELPSDCGEANTMICSGIEGCDAACGACGDALGDFYECVFEALVPGCNIECTEGAQGDRTDPNGTNNSSGATPSIMVGALMPFSLLAFSSLVGNFIN